jgi:hypothetical protein
MSTNKFTNKDGKVRVVKTKRYTDLETGEQIEAITITKDFNSDEGFKKVFLGEVLAMIDEISNAKMKFLLWMLNNIDEKNMIIGNYSKLSERSNVSESTISRLIPILKETNVIKQLQTGVYMLNPDICASVKSNKRQNLLIKYNSEE